MMGKLDQGQIYLESALQLNIEFYFIIEELFPTVYLQNEVQEIIAKYKNASN